MSIIKENINEKNSPIYCTNTQAQNVTIPDANFKTYLLGNSDINTNGDTEIQLSEAQSYTGILQVNDLNIADLTGIETFINLTKLVCYNNQLSVLDVSNNTNLTELECNSNQLNSLVTNNINLTKLACGFNQLSNLNVSNNTSLTELWCHSNQLSSLDISNNTNLTYLNCDENQLSSLNILNNTNLLGLTCSKNQLSSINVSNNANLIVLYCTYNLLHNLDVSNNTNLTVLSCSSNQFSSLDVSNNFSLKTLKCSDNLNLIYINLKNGNNDNFTSYGFWASNFENLPNLQNVCVDALNTDLTDFITAETGHAVNFSTDCSTLSVSDNQIVDFSVYPTPTEDILNINSKTEIVKVEIYSNLGQLISETTKNNIDVSNLAQGLYFVKVKDINGIFGVQKIVKK